jgi:hypothetical protein
MKYYKAINDKYMTFEDRLKGWAFVKDELLTERELKAYCERNKCNFDKLVESNFTTVEISARRTHTLFGCRFA